MFYLQRATRFWFLVGIQNFQSQSEIILSYKAFTISNKLYQFTALRGEGNFDPSMENKLNLYTAAVNLELEFGGNIQEFITKLKEPENEQSYRNLSSSNSVIYFLVEKYF